MSSFPSCTFARTGRSFTSQQIARCNTCWGTSSSNCMCIDCAYVCHAGHDVVIQPGERSAFCDCGCSGSCQLMDQSNAKCSLTATGPTYRPQAIFSCDTCGLTGGQVACYGCAVQCHAGHSVRFLRRSTGAYCDCGNSSRCTLCPPGTAIPSGFAAPLPEFTGLEALLAEAGEEGELAALNQFLRALMQPSVGTTPTLAATRTTRYTDDGLCVLKHDRNVAIDGFECLTCLAGREPQVVCSSCAKTCHAGHQIRELGITTAQSCHCGDGSTCLPCKSLEKKSTPTSIKSSDGNGSKGIFGEDATCVVCLDAEPDTAMVPCGHVVSCHACALKIHRAGPAAADAGVASCPVCRAGVTAVIRLHRG